MLIFLDGDDIFDPGNPKWQDVLQLSSFTPNLITKIIRTYWKFEVEGKFHLFQFFLAMLSTCRMQKNIS